MAAELEIKPSFTMQLRVVGVMLAALGGAGLLIYLLIGGGGDIFAQRATITTYMPDATGLSRESEVRLSGIRIGTVSRVELSGRLDPQRPVRVDMRVVKRYLRSIPVDSLTNISTDTLVGGAFVDISEGKSPATLPENGVVESEPYKQAADRADMIKVLTTNLARIDQLLIEVSSPDTKVGSFIVGSAQYDGALAKITSFDNQLHQFLQPESQTGQVLFSPKLYDQIRGSVVDADNRLAAIQRGEGTAGRLFASDEQYFSILEQLRGLRTALADANAGKGAAGALLHDDAAHARIVKLLASTDRAITVLNQGQGRAGELLSNSQLYESLNGTLRGIEALLKDVRTDPRKYLRIKY